MSKRVLRSVIFVIWVGLAIWLIRFEAFPERFSHTLTGYKSFLSENTLLEDSWMRILFHGEPIGYSHSSVEINDDDPERHYTASGTVHVRLKMLGTDQRIQMKTLVGIDSLWNLQVFTFKLFGEAYNLRISGHREKGNSFRVAIKTPHGLTRTQMVIPDDVIIYSPMMDMAMRKLKPGQNLTIKTLDPMSMATIQMTIHAVRRETLEMDGAKHEAMLLTTDFSGAEIRSWIDTDGVLLKQETPFGWIMERCTPDAAFEALKAAGAASDMLDRLAIPCEGTLKNPRTAQAIHLRFKGVAFQPDELQTHRQTVNVSTGNVSEITVRRESAFPKTAAPLSAETRASLKPYLESSNFVQAKDPALQKAAAKIVGDEQDPSRQAQAIFHWVHDNVRKEMTVSLPSALDVLKTMAGDCNEHTYLFVGLARAAGLPSRINVGLAYQNGAFYYHAWPSVYVGRWVECDPTWGQETVDATHISLVKGELADQIQIIKVMGRLKIQVVGEE